MRSFLGLDPHAPQSRLTVSPRLPQERGRIALSNLRLGDATVHIEAEGQAVKVNGLPDDWELLTAEA